MNPAIFAIFGSAFLVGLSGALMPGPLTTLTVREAMRHGFWAGPVAAGGHALAELVLVIALAFGLSQILDQGPATAAIAIVGGIFLMAMGLRTVVQAPSQNLRLEAVGSGEGLGTDGSLRPGAGRALLPVAAPLALAAVLVSVANPYWVIWWASVGTAYMTESLKHGAAGVVSFYGGHILSDLVWLTLVAGVLASGRRLMGRTLYRAILGLCGLFLLGLGGFFLASGVGLID